MVLPDEAFAPVSGDAAKTPALRVLLNNQLVSDVAFPLSSPPMVTARICEATTGSSKLPDVIANTKHTLTLECVDAVDRPANLGFLSAHVYFVDPESPSGRFILTMVRPLQGSIIEVTYQAPMFGSAAKTTYHCYAFLNTRPVAGSPFALEVINPLPPVLRLEISTVEHISSKTETSGSLTHRSGRSTDRISGLSTTSATISAILFWQSRPRTSVRRITVEASLTDTGPPIQGELDWKRLRSLGGRADRVGT